MVLKLHNIGFFVGLLTVASVVAQVWTNVKSYQSASNMFNQLRCDKNGTIYGAGWSFDSLEMSPGTYLSSHGWDDCMIFKADTGCVPTLIRSFGGPGIDQINDMVIRDNDNMIVTGQFQETMSIGTTRLVAPASESFFMAEFTTDSTPVWSVVNNALKGLSLAILKNGSVAVGGIMLSSTSFLPNDTLRGRGGQDLFMALYDKDGKAKWAVSAGSKVDDAGPLVTSFENSIYWCGHYYDTLFIDKLNKKIVAESPDLQAFLAKIDDAGKLVWVMPVSSTEKSVIHSMVNDSDGNLYITGTYSGTLQIDDSSVASTDQSSGFFAKLTPEGKPVWIRSVDLVSGNYLTPRTKNEMVLIGSFQRRMQLDTFSLFARDIEDVFVAGIAPDGKCTWILDGGCCRAALLKTAAVTSDKKVVVSGSVDRILVRACSIDFSGMVVDFAMESLGRTFFAALDPSRNTGIKRDATRQLRYRSTVGRADRFYDLSGREITRPVRVFGNGTLQRTGSAGILISQDVNGCAPRVVLAK